MILSLLLYRKASGFLAKFTLDGSQKVVVVTNNHFVATEENASRVLATFKFEGNNEIKTIKLDPDIFFRTNQVTSMNGTLMNQPHSPQRLLWAGLGSPLSAPFLGEYHPIHDKM
jgi:hypothetical protein